MAILKKIGNFIRYVFVGFYSIFYYVAKGILLVISAFFYLIGLLTKKLFKYDLKGLINALNSEYIILAVVILILFFGTTFLAVNLYSNYSTNKTNEEQKISFMQNLKELKNDVLDDNSETEYNLHDFLDVYNAVIKIDNINLFQGVVKSDKTASTIDDNVSYLRISDLPSAENGNFILAAHSGNDEVSYFKNLKRLKSNDEIKIYYNDNIYIYVVNKNFITNKNDLSVFDRIDKQTTITLITYDHNDNRIIVQGYLREVVGYKKEAFWASFLT